MIDWSRGYTARWRAGRLDPATWAEVGSLAGVDSVTVDRRQGGLLESCSVEASRASDGAFEEGWYRIEMVASQAGEVEAVPVVTALLSEDGGSHGGGSASLTLSGRSVLLPASERVLRDGAFAPKGADGAAWVAERLRECTPAPVAASGSFRIADHIVFDLGSTVLDAVWAVLGAAGWCLRVGGDGAIRVTPVPSEPSLALDRSTAGLVVPPVTASVGTGTPVNVVVVTDGGATVEVVNDDPASPTSVPSVGRRVEALEKDPARPSGESLPAYARRRLAELGRRDVTLTYDREWVDGLLPYDVVEADLPEWGLSGTLRVRSQRLTCGAGVVVSETLEEVA